jgi:hypothetical protein
MCWPLHLSGHPYSSAIFSIVAVSLAGVLEVIGRIFYGSVI